MNHVVEQCKEWMIKNATHTNCFTFLKLAENFNLESTALAITKFVLENFVLVSETEAFTDISKEALKSYLSSDILKTEFNECVVFKAAKNWITKNKIVDKMEVCEILKNIRFALISPDNLSDEILLDDMIVENKECRSMIGEAIKYHGNVYTQPFYKGNGNRPRGLDGVLVITNPDGEDDSYNIPDLRWYGGCVDYLTFPDFDCQCFNDPPLGKVVYESMLALQVNNFLFVFGTNCDGYQNFTKRYDATFDKWMDLAAVPRQATVGSSLGCTNDQRNIFLFGGMHVNKDSEYGVNDDRMTDTVYNYDVPNNSWRQETNMPVKLVYGASASLCNIMYVTGGFALSGTHFYGSVEVWAYDSDAKLWLSKPPMHHIRHNHALEACNGKLWAIGGIFAGVFATSIEAFDPVANQWTVTSTDLPGLHDASSIVHGHKIYLVGGSRKTENSSSEESSAVFVYDTVERKLTTVIQEFQNDYSRNICAQLTLGLLVN